MTGTGALGHMGFYVNGFFFSAKVFEFILSGVMKVVDDYLLLFFSGKNL